MNEFAICVSNRMERFDLEFPITVGKVYRILETKYVFGLESFVIVDDEDKESDYQAYMFLYPISKEEHREHKLEELGI
jgi:hypothetical protein